MGGHGVIIVNTKKDLIKIETVDNEVLLSIADLLKRIEKKHPDHLEVVKVDESHRTILFMSSSYVAANISRILTEEKEQSRYNEKEGTLKVERQ
ncbi:MAG TPA: hypothetical protein VFH28_09010 [Nitrososphaera sp.]|nr:hypothetical protein [Nitrososphaera sp.]